MESLKERLSVKGAKCNFQFTTKEKEYFEKEAGFTDEEVEVFRMRSRGQHWSYNQVKDFVESHGIKSDWTNWYLVLNMCYNDYYDTAKAFDLQDDPEFFFSLARDFIEDADAKPLKVEKYFLS